MSSESTIASERHPRSRRWAVVSDEGGHSAWLYLTAIDGPRPERDALVFSRVEPVSREAVGSYPSGGPPPVCEGFLVSGRIERRADVGVNFRWSKDGNSVCVLVDGAPRALASMRLDRGMSKDLARSGPWGDPWDDSTYLRLMA